MQIITALRFFSSARSSVLKASKSLIPHFFTAPMNRVIFSSALIFILGSGVNFAIVPGRSAFASLHRRVPSLSASAKLTPSPHCSCSSS